MRWHSHLLSCWTHNQRKSISRKSYHFTSKVVVNNRYPLYRYSAFRIIYCYLFEIFWFILEFKKNILKFSYLPIIWIWIIPKRTFNNFEMKYKQFFLFEISCHLISCTVFSFYDCCYAWTTYDHGLVRKRKLFTFNKMYKH